MKKMNKKGFTIVELVIVIAVIAILAAVLIPTFSNIIAKANESSALQACRNELIEMKAALATTGKDVPDGTYFNKDEFYFQYKDGSLTKCDNPGDSVKFTQLANVKISQDNAVEFNESWMTNRREGSVCAGVKFQCEAGKTWSIKVYKDGSIFYEESGSGAISNGCYFYLYANPIDTDVPTAKWYQKPASKKAAAGYYTYDLTTNNTTVTTGAFYYNGK